MSVKAGQAHLQELHAIAGRPSTRSISGVRGDFSATLSHERVRSILSGKSVQRWPTLETLVRVLVLVRGPAPRGVETEVARSMPLRKAADAGHYRGGEQLIYEDMAKSANGEGGSWIPRDIVKLLINPIYAIDIDRDLAIPLGRSAAELRGDISLQDPEVEAEVRRLESDASVLREAMMVSPETWEKLPFEAQRLVLRYMIDKVIVGPPTLGSPEEMLKIEWRVPAPAKGQAG